MPTTARCPRCGEQATVNRKDSVAVWERKHIEGHRRDDGLAGLGSLAVRQGIAFRGSAQQAGLPPERSPSEWLDHPDALVRLYARITGRDVTYTDANRRRPTVPIGTLQVCLCYGDHRPKVRKPQGHHLWPLYLGGPEHPGTLVWLCPNTHDWVHDLLRDMIRAGTWLPRSLHQPIYAHGIATLGFQAWDAAGRPTPKS